MRSGWREVEGRGTENRYEHSSGAYVRIGGDDSVTDEEFDERVDDAMIAAEGWAMTQPARRAEAPAGEFTEG